MRKKIISIVMCLGMIISMTACGKDSGKEEFDGPSISKEEIPKTEVLKVGDKTIYLDEVYLYAIQCAFMFEADVDAYLESKDTYNNMILSQIREANIYYNVAVDAGVEITEEQEAEAKSKANSYVETIGKDMLDKYGITTERVEEIFVQQYYYTALNNQICIELNEKYVEEISKQYEGKGVNQYYVVNVPYIEVDENNAPVVNDDGSYTMLSGDEKAEKQALAEEVAGEINNTNYAEILEQYELSAFSAEKWLFEGDSENEVAKAAEKLNVGEKTDVYDDGSKCYYFFIMLDKNNAEYKESFFTVYADSKTSEDLEDMQTAWLQSVEIDEVNDILGDTWSSLDFRDIISYYNDKLSKDE